MKMISANKLNRLWKNGVVAKMVAKTRVLKTKEEILANTSVENVAGAVTVKELINNLNSHPQFIYDETGRITGYKTAGGADTVFPFSSQLSTARRKTGSKSIASGGTATITLESKPLLIYAGFDSQRNHIWLYNGGSPIVIKGGTAGYESPTIISKVDVDNNKFTIKNTYTSTRSLNYGAYY